MPSESIFLNEPSQLWIVSSQAGMIRSSLLIPLPPRVSIRLFNLVLLVFQVPVGVVLISETAGVRLENCYFPFAFAKPWEKKLVNMSISKSDPYHMLVNMSISKSDPYHMTLILPSIFLFSLF